MEIGCEEHVEVTDRSVNNTEVNDGAPADSIQEADAELRKQQTTSNTHIANGHVSSVKRKAPAESGQSTSHKLQKLVTDIEPRIEIQTDSVGQEPNNTEINPEQACSVKCEAVADYTLEPHIENVAESTEQPANYTEVDNGNAMREAPADPHETLSEENYQPTTNTDDGHAGSIESEASADSSTAPSIETFTELECLRNNNTVVNKSNSPNGSTQETGPQRISKHNRFLSNVPTHGSDEIPPADGQPGKPVLSAPTGADTVSLNWAEPRTKFENFMFQVRYKTIPGRWKVYNELLDNTSVILRNLPSCTEFIFQVRMTNNEEEGPYSKPSEVIVTKSSAASQLLDSSVIVSTRNSGLTLRKLQLHEFRKARNPVAKTRKLRLGQSPKMHCKEKTIMLVGATGSGKSTLVDGIVNYVLGVNWNDPYRYTLVDLEEEEKRIIKNQALSQTHWITTYSINPINGSRLDYRLNIIDTPGFGDTRGFERDQKIVDQIRQLFCSDGTKGIVHLDAVCFLTKSPDARLTPTQRYIFNAILSLFGQDIAENINILVTFADGKAPPVLAALKEAQLPHDVYFPFNNSALFADNCGSNMSCLSPMFWDMGCSSFNAFFDNLKHMTSKSLLQTKEVLAERYILETTIENLSPLVSNGLNKLDELQQEIQLLDQHKTEIEANKDFVYTVTETKQIKKDLPRGRHVTNCLNCNVTCHKDCCIPKDEDKHGCLAMDRSGNCTQCVERCHWQQHANTPYIFEYEQEEKTKTYAEKEEKYRHSSNEKMTHEKVIDRMWDELIDLEVDILEKMDIVTKCNNRLRQIALRPNPLSIVEHIDLLIEGEKQEKRSGFQRRIATLMEFRKKSTIGSEVSRFRQDLSATRESTPTFHAQKKDTLFSKLKGIVGFT